VNLGPLNPQLLPRLRDGFGREAKESLPQSKYRGFAGRIFAPSRKEANDFIFLSAGGSRDRDPESAAGK
jgi:hypothetical protein